MNKKLIFLFLLIKTLNNHCNTDKILILSVPKCGTHLIAKAIELLTGKQLAKEILPEKIILNGVSIVSDSNIVFRSHLMYDKKIENELLKDNFKLFFIYRDPRDQIISSAYWIKKIISNYKWNSLTYDQLIDRLINRIPLRNILKNENKDEQKICEENFDLNNLIEKLILKCNGYYKSFLNWKNSKNICAVKFEDLIGQQGNGNDIAQVNELNKICKYLNVNSNSIDHCIKNLFGKTTTFREGKIGSWKRILNDNQIKLMKAEIGQLLIDLGYEKDLNW